MLIDSLLLKFSFESGIDIMGEALIIRASIRETMSCRHLALVEARDPCALAGPSIPSNFRKMRSMLSIVGYYRNHIPHYTLVTDPMTRFLCISMTFPWDDECQRSLQLLRDMTNTTQSALKYLVNKAVLGGAVCQWLKFDMDYMCSKVRHTCSICTRGLTGALRCLKLTAGTVKLDKT